MWLTVPLVQWQATGRVYYQYSPPQQGLSRGTPFWKHVAPNNTNNEHKVLMVEFTGKYYSN